MLVVEEECWKGARELVRSVWKVQHKGISHQEGVNAPFLWYLPLNSLQKWSYPLTWKCEHTIPMVSSSKFHLSLSRVSFTEFSLERCPYGMILSLLSVWSFPAFFCCPLDWIYCGLLILGSYPTSRIIEVRSMLDMDWTSNIHAPPSIDCYS